MKMAALSILMLVAALIYSLSTVAGTPVTNFASSSITSDDKGTRGSHLVGTIPDQSSNFQEGNVMRNAGNNNEGAAAAGTFSKSRGNDASTGIILETGTPQQFSSHQRSQLISAQKRQGGGVYLPPSLSVSGPAIAVAGRNGAYASAGPVATGAFTGNNNYYEDQNYYYE